MIDRRALAEIERRTGLRLAGRGERRLAEVGDGCGVGREGMVEGDDVVAALTVGETYFFRDPRQFELLGRDLLPEAARRRFGAPVEVWSAGCATGEEAYTVAITAAEAGLGGRVRVLGTDLNARALAAAEAGRYRPWALRGVDETRRRAWFDRHGERYQIRDAARRRVRFATANLLDGPPGRFDIVFCRNVLIYFTPEAIERTADVLGAAVRPGGWLITGASDPLLRTPDLVMVRTPHGIAYRKVDQHSVHVGAPPERHRARRTENRTPATAADPTVAKRPAAAIEDDAMKHEAVVARASVQDASQRRAEALALAEAAVAADPLDARLRHMVALLHLEAGDADAAAEAARAALFLAPELAVAHLVLGQAEQVRGHDAAARRAFRTGAEILGRLDAETPVEAAGGEMAGRLATLAARLAEEGDDAR